MPEKWIEVSWDKSYSTDSQHVGRLQLTLTNEMDRMATICSIIAKQGCNITNVKILTRSHDFFEMVVDIEVMGLTQLTNIIASLRSKECVHYVERFKP